MTSRLHRVILHRTSVPGLGAMTLFTNHRFPRHAHDDFGIGVVASGAQRSWSGIGEVEARAGNIITVNPGEIHDGIPFGDRPRGWRMLYLDPALVARELAEDVPGEFELARPVAQDPVLALRFHELFGLLTAPEAGPAIEEYLLRTLMRVARHHAVRPPYRERCAPQVRRVRQYLDEFPEAATSLADLAALAGVSRFQLIRGFARDVGMTPHAYLVQVRLRLVRRLLGTGISPAEAALRAGFADQSHMTRAFVRQFGVTPGRYRAAVI